MAMGTAHRRLVSRLWPWLVAALWFATLHANAHAFLHGQNSQDFCQTQAKTAPEQQHANLDCIAECTFQTATGLQDIKQVIAAWIFDYRLILLDKDLQSNTSMHLTQPRGPPVENKPFTDIKPSNS